MRRTLVLIAVAACSRDEAAPPSPAPVPAPPPPKASAVSTIARADYIGPSACGDCHPEEHAKWSTSLHRRMNQLAEPGAVIGEPGTLAYAGGTMTFAKGGTGYVMTLAHGGSQARYVVTRTIGVKGLQEYVGRKDGTGEEVRLPFAWWPRRAGWYPQPYFDPWFASEAAFDAYAPLTEPWAERCPWCHSTYPFAQRIARATVRPVGHGLEQAFTLAGGSERLDVAQQITTGISCESCHLGGRAHKDGAPVHFVPQGAVPRPGAPVPTTFAGERTDPAVVNRVCAQCHSGPSPRLPDGTALRNSSEALDLAASKCTTARCIDCHDPHTGGADEARAIAACTKCHTAQSAPAHAAHVPGTTCLDCHMPKLVMGIDRMVRTHRISSPTNPALLSAAAPNACNLCHLDRSIAWTAEELRRGHDVVLDPRRWTAYGDLERPVGEVWLASPEPALRLLATAAYARSPLAKYALPQLAAGLADPLPHLRAWTLFAVEEVLGRKVAPPEYDPRAAPDVRARQLRALPLR